jgi:MYXO-CTERM domain-containing protein
MCDGILGDCPDDLKVPSGTICRNSSGVCDPDEICDGRTNTCAPDVKSPDGALCPGGTCQATACRVESDLVIAAAASPGYNGPTSTLGYTLGVGNIGRSPTTNVVVSIMVPSGTGLITQRDDGSVGDGWTCRTKSESSAGVEIECTRPTLGVGENTLVAVGLRPPAGAESVQLIATVSSAILDPVLSNNTATLNQSLLSERYAGGGIGCSAASPRGSAPPASPVGWVLALFGALTLTFRRRRSS